MHWYRWTIAFVCLVAIHDDSPGVFSQEKSQITADQLILSGEVLDIDGLKGFVFLPDAAKQTRPQPWIMYAPTLLARYPDKNEKWMHEQFLAAGIAVAGIDAGEAYGSPAGCDAMDKLYKLLVKQRGFAERPCLLGRSRGGLWVSSWAIRNPSKVSGIAGIYPVFDWTTYPGIATAAPAYGLTADELEKQDDQLNPIRNIRKLADSKIPVTLIHGAIDKVVPLKQNSLQLKNVYDEAGQNNLVTLIVVEDQGHNFWPGFFQCQELVDFAIESAREK
jgi:dipeptidyl aminopeptidase/acylaminoacyl peptidase